MHRLFLEHQAFEFALCQVALLRMDCREVQPLDVDDALPDRRQPPVRDGLRQLVIERDRLEHLPEGRFVRPIRRGRHAKHTQIRILFVMIQHGLIATRRRVVGFVDDE